MPKSNAEIQRAFKARRDAEGLKRHEIRCHDQDWPHIQAYVDSKAERRKLIDSVDKLDSVKQEAEK